MADQRDACVGGSALRGEHRSRGRAEAVAEIRAERQVLVEERGAAGELLGGVVLEQGADDGAFGKGGGLRQRVPGESCQCGGSDACYLQCVAAGKYGHEAPLA